MSAFIVNFICSTIMSVMGLIVVKNISGSKEKIISYKSIILLMLLIVIPMVIYNTEYNYIYTIIVYGMTIIIYKYILNISYVKSIVSCGIMIISLFLLEFLGSLILAPFMTVEYARNTWYINIILNFVFMVIMIFIHSRNHLKTSLSKFVSRLENQRVAKILIAIIITIIVMSTLLYTVGNNFSFNSIFTNNILLFVIFLVLIFMLLGERNNYDKLSSEYDGLITHVKIFEDWIEQEQLNRHEFKNQLAVLRNMTKEKKVKDKIDKIISENINIDSEMINQLKNLPSGGFKGLLYYKIVLSRKMKIKLEIDVSDNVTKILSKLDDTKIEILSKLIGIYVDNAIEAALETKKKLVAIEIYSLDERVNIVITNTFNGKKDISKRFEKGISTKGEGRGNGLYFSKKLLSKNKWIEEKQDIVDNLYIQKLIINKKAN